MLWEPKRSLQLSLIHIFLLSVNDKDKAELIEVANGFHECGFELMGTGRTCDIMVAAGLPAKKVAKIDEGRPNILDKITNREVDIIINTPLDRKGMGDDSYIRKAAVKGKICLLYTSRCV